MIARVVITGAPGSGKTVCLEALKAEPRLSHFLFFDELARQLLARNPSYRTNRTEFHREIYRLQSERETAAAGRPFISDRGTVDAFAFHPETLTDVGTTLEQEYARYSAVVHLGSSARLGEQFYRLDAIRNESVSDALAIERAIEHAWSGHPGYVFIDACERFDDKLRQASECVLALALAQHR
jgi:predicted ATPase